MTVRKSTTTTITGGGSGPTVGELLATLRGLPAEARVLLTTSPSREQREPSTWTATVRVEHSALENTAMQSGYLRDNAGQFGDH